MSLAFSGPRRATPVGMGGLLYFLCVTEGAEGKVAFDPTDEVRPDDSRFLFVVQTRLSVVLLSVEAFFQRHLSGCFFGVVHDISSASCFLLRVQVIERFVVAASRLRGAVFSDPRFAKARSEGWVLAAAVWWRGEWRRVERSSSVRLPRRRQLLVQMLLISRERSSQVPLAQPRMPALMQPLLRLLFPEL